MTQTLKSPLAGRLLAYAAATAIIGIIALACLVFRSRIESIDVSMLFLLGVVVVASTLPRGPALLASMLSIACFDFLFVPPFYTFAVLDTAYLLTFAIMFVIALTMSRLTARIREQAAVATTSERRMSALYAMNRELATAHDRDAVATIVRTHVSRVAGGLVSVDLGPGANSIEAWDEEVVLFPINSPAQRFGLIILHGAEFARPMTDEETHLLELLADQAGRTLERLALTERNVASRVEIESERLRNALLSSLSHDLRTPLATIEGAATALAEDPSTLSTASHRDLAETIVEEVRRMARLVSNLLDMMRLETGMVAVHKSWQPLEEPLGVALIRLDERLQGYPVTVVIPADLPLVCVDDVLLEQVFLNLLDNAIKYTKPGTPISVTAWLEEFHVMVEVADRGPGLPVGEEAAVFRKLHRLPSGGEGTPPHGSGLGLTICEGILTAHGGRIWAEQRDGGGVAFRFTLPLETAPPPVPAAGSSEESR